MGGVSVATISPSLNVRCHPDSLKAREGPYDAMTIAAAQTGSTTRQALVYARILYMRNVRT
jgi:hypothetical protein